MPMFELQNVSGGKADKQNNLGERQKLHKAQASSSLEGSVFDEIADEQTSTSLSSAPVGAAILLETHHGKATTSQEDKPLQCMGVNKVQFPTLAQMSHRQLSTPCSSYWLY